MLFVLLMLVTYGYHAASQPPKPRILIRAPPTLLDSSSSSDSSCPAQSSIDLIDKEIRKTRDLINSNFINSNYQLRPCKCGGPGWTRVINLDMADHGNMCPSNWTLHERPIRGCGRSTSGRQTCDSATYSVHGRTYSSVCGRILAYQKAWAGAFYNAIRYNLDTIDTAYLSGVSLTHGPAETRKHIWSFVGAWYEHDTYNYFTYYNCPCTNTNVSWPHQVPPFINNDYFCDTGNPGPDGSRTTYFTDDPLWDGEGCGSASTCCEFNSPPWFCKSLPQPTSDDLEIRNCYAHSSYTSYAEDRIITLIDIYVK